MSDTVICVEHLSKLYRIGKTTGHRDTLREALAEGWLNLRRSVKARSSSTSDGKEMFWALQDVSFSVPQGTVLGIIGKNGAGKSTLLKVLSRITEPTSGVAYVSGRIGSLLEVGTGFHPELTGRENIYLNGTILGMRRKEIARHFDEIVAFSGIEKFLETPVKRYSSGMYVRLAFAVAAHLEPEVLLVDEVLAVGDAEFQRKCLGKMQQVAHAGRTVLFVSHNMGAVNALTERCIYLRNGQIAADDMSGKVIEQYLTETQGQHPGGTQSVDLYRREFAPHTPVRTTAIWVNDSSLEAAPIAMGESFAVHVEIQAIERIADANVTIVLKNSRSDRVAVLFSWDREFFLTCEPGVHVVKAQVQDLELPPGRYVVDVGINQSAQTTAYDLIVDYPAFSIATSSGMKHWIDRSWGAVHTSAVDWSLLNPAQ
jgi:lipopolysaccharide transport system ATP-binding protein